VAGPPRMTVHDKLVYVYKNYCYEKKQNILLLLPEMEKFITATVTGRRLTPSGKRIRSGTIEQYRHVCKLLKEFEEKQKEPLRILLLLRSTLRHLQQEKNYWKRFFKHFSHFLYRTKHYYDQYAGSVFKVIKVFFHYLSIERGLPVGEFHQQFRTPAEQFVPVVLTPQQLRWLITDETFYASLRPSLRMTRDIFVFGCMAGMRYSDLMRLKKTNIRYLPEGTSLVLETRKTGATVQVPLPDYAIDIIEKYKRKAGKYVLPGIANSNFNLNIKRLIQKAGWDHPLPKYRHRQGETVEIKNRKGEGWRFYNHITAHTMRRTAITTLLLLGVDESSVRHISGHAAGSKEFYRYVVLVQDYLNAKVKEAHKKLLSGEILI
jgi:integrase